MTRASRLPLNLASRALWSPSEQRLLKSLSTPLKIQSYLDSLKYNIRDWVYSPRGVMRAKAAHCFDGAFFAAAALEFHGTVPLIVDLRANGRDDDHLLAIYKTGGLFGAIAKSNFNGCRFRDPVFRTIRELVMSYFHIYFNTDGERTLSEYSTPINLQRFNDIDWRRTSENLEPLAERIDSARHFRIIPRRTEQLLSKADPRLIKAEMLGVDRRGVYKVTSRGRTND